MSGPRSRHSPTTDSVPTPFWRRRCASLFARASNSPYVSVRSPETTATESGRAAARSAISSWMPFTGGRVAVVSVQVRRRWSRSGAVSNGSAPTGRPGSAATASRSAVRCPVIRSIVAASKRAVLNWISPVRAPSSSPRLTIRSNLTGRLSGRAPGTESPRSPEAGPPPRSSES